MSCWQQILWRNVKQQALMSKRSLLSVLQWLELPGTLPRRRYFLHFSHFIMKIASPSILLSMVMLGVRRLMQSLEIWLAGPLLAESIKGELQ